MSLRTRLWITLGVLFLLPLLVGGVLLVLVVPGASSERVARQTATGARAVAIELSATCADLGVLVRSVALESAVADDPARAVANAVRPGGAGYAAVLGSGGEPVAQAGRLPGIAVADLGSCASGQPSGALLAERVPVSGVPGATAAVVARPFDPQLLGTLQTIAGPDAVVVLHRGGDVLATTGDPAVSRRLAAGGAVDGWVMAGRRAPPLPLEVVVAAPVTSALPTTPLLLIVAATVLSAGLLVASVARGLSRPYAELTEAAERVAKGDLDTHVESDVEGEAGRLGSALNQMTDELRRNVAELERHRQELRESLERIGDTLSATHDLEGLLHVVLETAVGTLGSRAGVVVYRTGEQVQVAAEVGLHDAGLPAPVGVRPGVGVLGRVLATGSPVVGRLGSGPEHLEPRDTEPSRGEVLAVPLRSMGAVVGVLALYGRLDGRSFDSKDEDALGTLAGQASIAIDNVHLHQEAQRLSTTDPLTGVWNFRYLSMGLAREIERSTRFERPLAVLMLDLDHFKQVNDNYGHARGDAVLRELADRVQEQIREVDTFARYGGEEFVVLLPETTVEGAAQLADRICTAVRREPFCAEGEEPLRVTVSIGGAAFPQHGASGATLMRVADKALYVAKAQGRDRWHIPGSAEPADG